LGSEFVVTMPVASSASAAKERAQPVAPHRILSAAPGRLVAQRGAVAEACS
jgi:hypothetical protein